MIKNIWKFGVVLGLLGSLSLVVYCQLGKSTDGTILASAKLSSEQCLQCHVSRGEDRLPLEGG